MRPSKFAYTTPESIVLQLDKANNGSLDPDSLADYNDLYANSLKYCYQASAYITKVTGRVFVPFKETRNYYHSELRETGNLRRGRLDLGEDLFVLSSVTWADVELSAADYLPLPVNALPYDSLRFSPSANLSFTPSDFASKTTVSGTWGYHVNVSDAYTTVSTSITLANSTDTVITVTDASLYETLQLVSCESELMLITGRTTDPTNTLTVERGVNGTTAAAHTAQPLRRFNVMPDIALCATRLASFLYERRNSVGNVVQVGDGSVILDTLPTAVKETLDRYTRRTWGSVTGS